jgi:hypothetical protein
MLMHILYHSHKGDRQMKRITVQVLSISWLLLLGSVSANATIIHISDKIFQDNDSGLHWFNNPYYFAGTTQNNINHSIRNFDIATDGWIWDNWRLATQSEVYQLYTHAPDDDSLFTVWRNPLAGNGFIAGRTSPSAGFVGKDVLIERHDYNWDFINFLTYDASYSNIGAFIVATSRPHHAPVPEPAAALLFATGLACLINVKRKREISLQRCSAMGGRR